MIGGRSLQEETVVDYETWFTSIYPPPVFAIQTVERVLGSQVAMIAVLSTALLKEVGDVSCSLLDFPNSD